MEQKEIIYLVILLLLLVPSVLILMGKADFLIAGYNTMSDEEKSKVNIKRLRIVVAYTLILSVIILALPVFLGLMNNPMAHILAVILIFLVCGFSIYFANTWAPKFPG